MKNPVGGREGKGGRGDVQDFRNFVDRNFWWGGGKAAKIKQVKEVKQNNYYDRILIYNIHNC